MRRGEEVFISWEGRFRFGVFERGEGNFFSGAIRGLSMRAVGFVIDGPDGVWDVDADR